MARKIIPIKTKKRKPVPQGSIIEEGSLSNLKYRVFKRGNIHIFNSARISSGGYSAETLLFKKDCEIFEKEVDNLRLNELKDGESKRIEGCGDNDTIIFSCKKGDIEITLEKRAYSMLSKLKRILTRK